MDKVLYSKIKNRIKYSKQITINEFDVDDLVHDTIFKLYDRDIKDSNDCLKLCVIVARNIFLDRVRRESKFRNIYDSNLHNIAFNEPPEREFKEPVKYREFYIMKYKLDMSLTEISEFLDRNPNTVRGDHSKMKVEFRKLNNL